MNLLAVLAPFLRQAWLRGQQNLKDLSPILAGESRELGALFAAGQNLKQTVIDVFLGGRRQIVERRRIYEVAAGIFEDPFMQIEIAQRTALRIARAERREFLCIPGRPSEWGLRGPPHR